MVTEFLLFLKCIRFLKFIIADFRVNITLTVDIISNYCMWTSSVYVLLVTKHIQNKF